MEEKWFPFWKALRPEEQAALRSAASERLVRQGEVIDNGAENCAGLLLVKRGQLRVYTVSEAGKEITLYRLLEGDLCLFSAACVLHGVTFTMMAEAREESCLTVVPSAVWKQLMESSLAVANYTNALMASRFSDVMWLLDQILNQRADARLASLLCEEALLSGSAMLKVTHEQLARDLGTAREVVTRLLRYFQAEGIVSLSRGKILITDQKRLQACSTGGCCEK